MFNKCSILVTLVMAVAVTASVIPTTVEERIPFNITYIGNDLLIGKRVSGDYQLTQYGVWGYAEDETSVITKTLEINTFYELTHIAAYDQTPDKSSAAIPTLVSGGPGSKAATILFTSAPGKDIYFWVDVFGRR